MLKKVKKVPIFGLFMVFLGCSEGNHNNINENNKTNLSKADNMGKKTDKNSTKMQKNDNFLNKVGFEFKNEKIILDLNKTKNFISDVTDGIENVILDINKTFK
jgi:hypothetical protein